MDKYTKVEVWINTQKYGKCIVVYKYFAFAQD